MLEIFLLEKVTKQTRKYSLKEVEREKLSTKANRDGSLNSKRKVETL